MKFLVIAAVSVVLVLAKRDPTKVCAPDTLQTGFYDFNRDDYGLAVADFTKNLTSLSFYKSGVKVVYDNNNMKGYLTNKDGACSQFPLDATQLTSQCLPSNAVELANDTIHIGLSSSGTKITTWEIQSSATAGVRVAVTNQTPAIPVLRQVLGGTQTKVAGDVLFFTNPSTTIDNTSMLFIPSVCPPAVVV
ncbi:uncharacterized protein LOC131935202 [Physella acuta]|uniref:uncharacterized protein LOC131935202 n=1 Tax=Physella acuta TaxID=109671 RepID=UPI0027DE30EA|nr:uncharacterized protein LOC131935202 [Physella acuta]XP_059147559.1 uncharacterized protein LOC131935202 [Physella acuta]